MQIAKRWRHFAAIVLIGDGVMALVRPRSDAQAWEASPQEWRDLMQGLRRNPTLTRVIATAQIVGGICWVLLQENESNLPTSRLDI
jgi:hypothetical protein